jgi:hypothetical protein
MSAWYGFNRPEYGPDLQDPARRVPDERFAGTVSEQVEFQLTTPQERIIPCCTKPQPCHTWIQWKPQFSECPATFMPWNQLSNGKLTSAEIGQKDTRIWVADLDAMHYARGLLVGAEWWAESTKPHIRNRQQFAQYLQSTLFPSSTPHEKPVDRVEDAYAMLQHKYGPNAILYTTF